MRTVLSFPGTMDHAQHIALALLEADALAAFVTTFAFERGGRLDRVLRRLPGGAPVRLADLLARRSLDRIPARLVRQHPSWEIVRLLAQRMGASAATVDGIWDRASRYFDEIVARRHVSDAEAVYGFEYTALATFERAARDAHARILELPALDNAAFAEIERREREKWPELAATGDTVIAGKFAKRQERRRREIDMADVIVTNSRLTARSHIRAGADASKVHVVPLGAPSSIERISEPVRDAPLRAVYAGPFSLRKGAHYLLAAWRELKAGDHARLDVYGSIQVPDAVLRWCGDGIAFHGSVPRAELFEAFENADVLVFPTLSDGFGMVVTEAMARGLPVITSDQAGAADLVTRDNGIVVPAADAGALAEAFRWCLDNRARLAEMRPHALKTARDRQWSDYRRELIATLDNGLRSKGYRPTFRESSQVAHAS